MICPICGKQLISNQISKESFAVNAIACINCSFEYKDDSIFYELNVGGKGIFYSYNISSNERSKLYRKIKKHAWKYRKKLLRESKISGRGNMQYFN